MKTIETDISNPWKTLTETIMYDNPWLTLKKYDVINPAGNPTLYSVVHFKNTALGIIPLDNENNTWIVGQFRYPLNQYSWEIIEGGGLIGIDSIESAKRELHEEAGIKATEWKEIMQMHLSNSVTDEFCKIFVARGLTFHEPDPEESEKLEVKKLPFAKVYDMVMDGTITDSVSVAGILKTHILLQKGLV